MDVTAPASRCPPELIDVIIDHLYWDLTTLRTCSLVARSWLPSSRYHLFRAITLSPKLASSGKHTEVVFMELLTSPFCTFHTFVRRLQINLGPVRTTQWFLDSSDNLSSLSSINTLHVAFLSLAELGQEGMSKISGIFRHVTCLQLDELLDFTPIELRNFLDPFQELNDLYINASSGNERSFDAESSAYRTTVSPWLPGTVRKICLYGQRIDTWEHLLYGAPDLGHLTISTGLWTYRDLQKTFMLLQSIKGSLKTLRFPGHPSSALTSSAIRDLHPLSPANHGEFMSLELSLPLKIDIASLFLAPSLTRLKFYAELSSFLELHHLAPWSDLAGAINKKALPRLSSLCFVLRPFWHILEEDRVKEALRSFLPEFVDMIRVEIVYNE